MATKKKPRQIGKMKLGNRGEVLNFDHQRAGVLRFEKGETSFAIAITLEKACERSVENWFRGRSKPRPGAVRAMANIFGVSVSDLLADEKCETVEEVVTNENTGETGHH